MESTTSYEWARPEEGNKMAIGISMQAQALLGEIVYVELPPIGKQIEAGEEIAVLESTKAATDIYSPVSGIVVEVNKALTTSPDLLNTSPEEKGWICKVQIDS